jgi:phage-related protein
MRHYHDTPRPQEVVGSIMPFEIVYYSEAVQHEIASWPVKDRAVYVRITELMQTYGSNLGMPYTRRIAPGLFEIRAKSGRAFYCTEVEKKIVILHAFIKKSQKSPKRHIETAKKRMKEYKG